MALARKDFVAVLEQKDSSRTAAGVLEGLKRLRGAADLLSGAPKHGGKLQPLISLAEILLTLGIALFVGKAFWALFAPAPIAQSPPAPAARAAVPDEIANPFLPPSAEIAVVDAAPTVAETSLNLALRGTWHDGAGRGTAVIEVQGAPQKVFRIGEDICCGAKLEEVYADRAIISRGGAREALLLPNKRTDQGAIPTLASAQAPPAGPVVSIAPMATESGGMELRLFPGGDPGQFEALGLRQGDILVSVNGSPAPVDVAAAALLFSNLSRDDVAQVTIKRDGIEFPLDVAVSDWLGAAGVN